MREGTLQAQLSACQTQINPHFVYNTLNIISAKSMESGNYEVIEICDQFAQMLRYATDTRSRTATMAEELENVRYYLMLSKARYEDNLEFTIDVPDNLNALVVPKLTLQPAGGKRAEPWLQRQQCPAQAMDYRENPPGRVYPGDPGQRQWFLGRHATAVAVPNQPGGGQQPVH